MSSASVAATTIDVLVTIVFIVLVGELVLGVWRWWR